MLAQMDFLFQATRHAHSYMPMHDHTCYELVYYQSGKGLTSFNDKVYTYTPGTYTIIAAGTLHDERRTEDTDVIFVGFRLSRRELLVKEGLYQDDASSPILPLLLKMIEEMQEQRAYYADQLNHYISSIVIAHQRASDTGTSGGSVDHLLYARAFIDENCNQKITIEELAEMVGYSYHHFRHLFKDKFGVSPISYLLRKRIQKAEHLLLHSALPVTTIAMECGFSNDAQFCTMFKREKGESPRTFRQSRAIAKT
ncbi:AraC family transcriptional regulator [Paenibacillus sp. CF384]|uniref:helix-turn-helix transcriptional regulator n=1 Tax=Paenibacillus sp. CF384 TaxID=1884382 RepID=UPI00089540E5|nr:AraC family transcriptional regulator [Paenibacillus sp. CF384]SDX75169.1 transcriptional regulator, AraC family [Paenibacillus sp. CF384]